MKPAELLERLAALLAGTEADLLSAFAPSALASDGSTDLTPVEVIDHLKALTSPTILHAVCDASALTAVVQAVDEVTGLTIRESWSFLLEDGLIKSAIICCGGALLQTRQALVRRQVEPYLAGFGFRYPAPEDQQLIGRAAEAVSAGLGHEAAFEHSDALLNDVTDARTPPKGALELGAKSCGLRPRTAARAL